MFLRLLREHSINQKTSVNYTAPHVVSPTTSDTAQGITARILFLGFKNPSFDSGQLILRVNMAK